MSVHRFALAFALTCACANDSGPPLASDADVAPKPTEADPSAMPAPGGNTTEPASPSVPAAEAKGGEPGVMPGPAPRDGGIVAAQGGAHSAGGAGSAVGGTAGGGTTTIRDAGASGEGGSTNDWGVRLPDGNASFDYQLGGAYEPPEGVQVVSRDRNDPPAEGRYNICYVNGFQSQPDEEDFWYQEHPDLLLRDEAGEPVVDEDWGELLFDTSTEQKRIALSNIVGEWILGCAVAGFDAVEIDNLDSYSRSGGLLSAAHNVEYMQQLGVFARSTGLAVGQKNSTELLGAVAADFAVAEECNRWDECNAYRDVFGDRVFVIEYRREDFDRGCADFPELSIVLRDLDVSTPSSGSYVYEGC